MKRILGILVVAFLVTALLVAGCSKPAPTPTATPVPPTPTRAPVATTAPTSVAAPTPTPVPTATATAAPTPTPVPVKPKELKFFSYVSTTTPLHTEVFTKWVAELEKRTNGRVKATIFPAEALGPYTKVFELVRTGVADLTGTMVQGYTAGVFPLSQVIEIPFAVNDAWQGTKALEYLYDKGYLQNEWREVKVNFLFTINPYEIFTTKKPIRTLEDMKGLKIRSTAGAMEEAVKALGAVPVVIPAGDIYLSMERGVLDGSISSVGSLLRLKLIDVTGYVTKGLAVTSLSMASVMNKQVYDSFPPDVQKTINDLNREAQKWVIDTLGIDDTNGWKAIQDKKGVVEISPAERQRFVDKVAPIWDNWSKEMDGKGLQGTKVLQEFRSFIASYKP